MLDTYAPTPARRAAVPCQLPPAFRPHSPHMYTHTYAHSTSPTPLHTSLHPTSAHFTHVCAQVRVVDASTGKRTAFGLEGDVEIVSARERGRSGSSTGGLGAGGGQGESELQLQRRRIADRRKLLLRRLEEVRAADGAPR